MATELLGKSKSELRQICMTLGGPAYRGAQIYHALYAERKFDIPQMTNLPVSLREHLAKEAQITLPIIRQRYISRDGSVRYLLELPEGKAEEFPTESAEKPREKRLRSAASVEAVFMPAEG